MPRGIHSVRPARGELCEVNYSYRLGLLYVQWICNTVASA
jgi:hypothetical protein